MIQVELEEDEAQLIVDLLTTCPRNAARAIGAHIAGQLEAVRLLREIETEADPQAPSRKEGKP